MTVGSGAAPVSQIEDVRREMYRQQILTAAELEFSRSGFAETKVNAIAQTAGVSLATVYKSFEGKAEIWDSLHTDRMAALRAEADDAVRGAPTALEAMLAGIRATALFLARHDTYLDLSLRAGAGWTTAETAHGVQRTVWSAGLDLLVAGAEAARREGSLTDIRPRIAAGMVVSALQVWLADWVAAGRDRDPEVVVEEMLTHLRRLLLGPS